MYQPDQWSNIDQHSDGATLLMCINLTCSVILGNTYLNTFPVIKPILPLHIMLYMQKILLPNISKNKKYKIQINFKNINQSTIKRDHTREKNVSE